MKILWVVKDVKAAKQRAKMLQTGRQRKGEDDHHKIVLPYQALLGYRFDEVIFDGFNPYAMTESKVETQRIVDWLDYTVRTCLAPGGEIRMLTRGL